MRNDFSDALLNLMNFGNNKFRHLMLTVPANCGKSFRINPKQNILNCFQNLASTFLPWVRVEKVEH